MHQTKPGKRKVQGGKLILRHPLDLMLKSVICRSCILSSSANVRGLVSQSPLPGKQPVVIWGALGPSRFSNSAASSLRDVNAICHPSALTSVLLFWNCLDACHSAGSHPTLAVPSSLRAVLHACLHYISTFRVENESSNPTQCHTHTHKNQSGE
jgi:hypothetical protein